MTNLMSMNSIFYQTDTKSELNFSDLTFIPRLSHNSQKKRGRKKNYKKQNRNKAFRSVHDINSKKDNEIFFLDKKR